ncbi:phosphoribosylformylglycinamidine synthase subunit PurS [Flavobacteriales bacterium]|nr:phosphoribosylformylglycinamidine synthase subunit PurS [Flavobacteriales bacterium]
MRFKASIDIMPLEALLDPQGKAVSQSMNNLSLTEISNVRIGKHITLFVETRDENSAKKIVEDACKKLLCNQIMESFTFTLSPSKL